MKTARMRKWLLDRSRSFAAVEPTMVDVLTVNARVVSRLSSRANDILDSCLFIAALDLSGAHYFLSHDDHDHYESESESSYTVDHHGGWRSQIIDRSLLLVRSPVHHPNSSIESRAALW